MGGSRRGLDWSSSSSANTHTHNSGIWGCRLPRLELVTVRPFDLLKRASLFHALLHANLITDFAFPATQPASQRTLRHRPSPAAIIAVPGVFVHPPSSIAKSSKMRSTGDLPLSFPVIVTHRHSEGSCPVGEAPFLFQGVHSTHLTQYIVFAKITVSLIRI